jgi:hypothetical protein
MGTAIQRGSGSDARAYATSLVFSKRPLANTAVENMKNTQAVVEISTLSVEE